MKIKFIFFSMIILTITIHLIASEKYVRGVNHWGLFAEFICTLHHLDWCIDNNKIPVVYWDKESAYYQPEGYNGSHNVWEYYFEPTSTLKYEEGDKIHREYVCPGGKLEITYDEYFKDPMWPSIKFRLYVAQRLLSKFIKIKPPIKKKMQEFYKKNFTKGIKTIGVHLRGKHMLQDITEVPILAILDEANKYADGKTQFFVATDQIKLLTLAKEKLKGKVINYDVYRADQPTAPWENNNFLKDIPYKKALLGEEVLIEALLLSKCDMFIHTISYVSTAVLFFNPWLPHKVLHRQQVGPYGLILPTNFDPKYLINLPH